MEDKVCTKCKVAKPATDEYWSKHKQHVDGFQSWCRVCVGISTKKASDDRIEGKRPYVKKDFKKCYSCKNTYPATKDYYNKSSRAVDGIGSACRKCGSSSRKNTTMKRLAGTLPYTVRTEKHCKMCDKTKPINEFRKSPHRADGVRVYCKSCQGILQVNRKGNKHLNDKLTVADYDLILQAYDYRCAYCPADLLNLPEGVKLHWDHRLPVSKGGNATYENISPSCSACNMSKHDLTAEEFIQRRKTQA